MANLARFIRAKMQQALRGKPPRPAPEPGRVPPGQRVVDNFPILDLGTRPRIKLDDWVLEVDGEVEQPLRLDWHAFQALPRAQRTSDIHCVTRWSRLDVPWAGVAVAELLARVRPRPGARYATLYGYDGYTTNVPVEALLHEGALLADTVDGAPLDTQHGGPVRLVMPRLYLWKSAKWIKAIELHAQDRPGFWETRGYHNDADPWREQRYGKVN